MRAWIPLAAVAALAGGPASAAAQDGGYAVGSLDLVAKNRAGRTVRTVLPGQTWRLTGRLTPTARRDRIDIAVAQRGREVLTRTVTVRRVTRRGLGRFSLRVRLRRPGTASVTATRLASSRFGATLGEPLTVKVPAIGRRRAGCDGAATVLVPGRPRTARAGRYRLSRGALLQTGARVRVPARSVLRVQRDGAIYRVERGTARLECESLRVERGLAFADADRRPATVALAGLTTRVARGGRALVAARPQQVRFARGGGSVRSSAFPTSRVRTTKGDIVIPDGALPRMSTWPFAQSPEQRQGRPADGIPNYWAVGGCASGCRPAIGRRGWPLKPFRQQHPLRSGLNEWRPANAHIGIDIQAHGEQKVYAIQGGRASISDRGTADEHIRVGSYEYWHVVARVREGQYVKPYTTVLGTLVPSARHLHVSEMPGYRNPLRPGGINLAPYVDTEAPVVGRVAGGTVEVFDPQSVRRTIHYRTPVLAPAAVSYRAFDGGGRAVTGLRFAYRGAQHYGSTGFYAGSMHPPASPNGAEWAWSCFDSWTLCRPRWTYPVSGIPASAASVRVYAQDWAGNVSVRETRRG